jgi:TfoX/Sxy family transcriptional regulator of competence genes
MAYDEGLAQRTREILGERPGLVEKRMFGGIGFILHGNMACGVHGDALIVRTGSQRYEEALGRSYTRQFDITGRAMKGWVMVGSGGTESDQDLQEWVQHGIDFARTLPPK